MIGTFRDGLAKLAVGITVCFPQILAAEGFTGEQFLGWPQEAKTTFFQNSLLMASTISSRIDSDHADCVSDWYFESDVDQEVRNQTLLETVAEYPEFHPSAVILAVLERECGQYGGAG